MTKICCIIMNLWFRGLKWFQHEQFYNIKSNFMLNFCNFCEIISWVKKEKDSRNKNLQILYHKVGIVFNEKPCCVKTDVNYS